MGGGVRHNVLFFSAVSKTNLQIGETKAKVPYVKVRRGEKYIHCRRADVWVTVVTELTCI